MQDSLVSSVLFYAQENALDRTNYLFPSRKGGHITKQRADQIIRKAAREARLQRNVHAHLFRHGYAINFLNHGGRLDALQEQLGHRDINTTRIYLRLSDAEEAMDALDIVSSRGLVLAPRHRVVCRWIPATQR